VTPKTADNVNLSNNQFETYMLMNRQKSTSNNEVLKNGFPQVVSKPLTHS